MFTLLLVPVLIFLLFQLFQLRELKKHDIHLYDFCQLRSDSILYLKDNYESLHYDDYVELRGLISTLDLTIGNYKHHRNVLFNFRLFVKYLTEFKEIEKASFKVKTKNKTILTLIERMNKSVFFAFIAYTPFLKHELILNIIIKILLVGAYTGQKSVKRILSKVTEAKDIKEIGLTRYCA